MQEDLELSVEQLLLQLKRKGIPLPAEIGAFIVLESVEQIARSPVRLGTRDIILGEIGEIMVVPPNAPTSDTDAVRGLLRLLSDLLVCSAPGVPPMLLELVEQDAGDGTWTLARLRDELEAALLPLNRGATRRVLARLLREVQREGDRNSLRPSGAPDADDLDAQLDVLLGDATEEEVAERLAAKQASEVIPESIEDDHGDDLIAQSQQRHKPRSSSRNEAEPRASLRIKDDPKVSAPAPPIPSLRAQKQARPASETAVPEADPQSDTKAEIPVVPKRSAPKLRDDELFDGEPKTHSGGAVLGGIFVLIAVVLAIAYATLGQVGARKLLGIKPDNATSAEALPPTAAAKLDVGELHVHSTPARAQVFLLVGRGPALAKDLPLGIAHEFVALAEGRAPSRALVAADAAWEDSTEGPRYELAMQTGAAAGGSDQLELGHTLLSPHVGTPQAKTGTVRIITTPPGAKVYQLVGFTPDARVDNLALDRGYDLMVYAPGYDAEQRHLEAGDFQPAGGKRIAVVELSLRKRQKR